MCLCALLLGNATAIACVAACMPVPMVKRLAGCTPLILELVPRCVCACMLIIFWAVPGPLQITAVFFIYFVIDGVVTENVFELTAALVLDGLVLARVLFYVIVKKKTRFPGRIVLLSFITAFQLFVLVRPLSQRSITGASGCVVSRHVEKILSSIFVDLSDHWIFSQQVAASYD